MGKCEGLIRPVSECALSPFSNMLPLHSSNPTNGYNPPQKLNYTYVSYVGAKK
jgi:hypothetical protein